MIGRESLPHTPKRPTKWVRIKKRTDAQPKVRCRLVVQELCELFAGTPSLAIVELLKSGAAEKDLAIMLLPDMKRALLYKAMRRKVYIELPNQDPTYGDGNIIREAVPHVAACRSLIMQTVAGGIGGRWTASADERRPQPCERRAASEFPMSTRECSVAGRDLGCWIAVRGLVILETGIRVAASEAHCGTPWLNDFIGRRGHTRNRPVKRDETSPGAQALP